MTSQTLFQNTFSLRRIRVVIFGDIIKIATMFFKQLLRTQKKLKELAIVY